MDFYLWRLTTNDYGISSYSSGVNNLLKTDKNIMYKFYKKKVIGIFSKPTRIDVYSGSSFLYNSSNVL